MNTLVTGGFGFVGSHLVEELMAQEPQGHIHVVDDMSTSVIDHEHFVDGLGNPSNLTYDITTVKKYLQNPDEHFDRVYHLASIVGAAGVLPRAGDIVPSIVEDADLIGKATLRRRARLLNISTSEIYGGGHSAESDPKIVSAEITARLEYAVGKLAAEVALTNTHRMLGLDVVTVRPFNIAGARQSAVGGFVLPRFAQSALANEPLTVFGDGTQVRAFTHAADMATGIRLAMERGQSGDVYNIGQPENLVTIGALAKRVIELAGSSSTIEYIDGRELFGELYAEANDKVPNSDKAQSELGWHPTRNIDDIIISAIRWEQEK